MPRHLTQCDLVHPGASLTKYAPCNLFDMLDIPTAGRKIVTNQRMQIARELIRRGLEEIKKTNTHVGRIWKCKTGYNS